MIGRRDDGAGVGRQRGEQMLPVAARGNAGPIQRQLAPGFQSRPDFAQFGLDHRVSERGVVDGVGAHGKAGVAALRQNVDCIVAGMRLCPGRDLRQATLAAVNQLDFDPGTGFLDAGDESLPVGHRGVDERDFGFSVVLRRGGGMHRDRRWHHRNQRLGGGAQRGMRRRTIEHDPRLQRHQPAGDARARWFRGAEARISLLSAHPRLPNWFH